MCSNFKSFDLDTLFQGSNTAFMGMFKNLTSECVKNAKAGMQIDI